MSLYPNIDLYFKGRKVPAGWCQYPVILRWLSKPSMQSSVKIIDDKVGYLLNQPGGVSKLTEWFLSGDQRLITISAERYILDYLRSINPTLTDILGGKDVDASIFLSGQEYGVEVTCLLSTEAEWVIVERIQQYIEHHSIWLTSGLVVSAGVQALQQFTYLPKSEQCDIIERLSKSVGTGKDFTYMGFSIHARAGQSHGGICWEFDQDDADPFGDFLHELSEKISDKSKQLQRRNQNILFISMGSMPVNRLFPALLKEMTHPNRWKSEIADLENAILDIIRPTTVKGICLYVYSLPMKTPFYPLKLISDDSNLTSIKL